MNITPKFQQGGGFSSLFVTYNPVPQQQAQPAAQPTAASTAETKKSEDDGITKKDIAQMLDNIDGLPSDMQAVQASLVSLLTSPSIGNSSDLSVAYMNAMTQLKIAKFNKLEYDKAYTAVQQNGGLDEQAITASGTLVVFNKDTNGIDEVTVNEFLKDKGKTYGTLTNSNLLQMRAWRPEYVNKNNILGVVSNGIGMKEIHELASKMIGTLGTSEQAREQLNIKKGSVVAQGLQVLNDAQSQAMMTEYGMSLDGLYKAKVITKTQKDQAEAALNYVYSMLPTNARTMLKLRSGDAKNPDAGARKILGALVMSKMDSTYDQSIDYLGGFEKVMGKSSGSKKGSGSGEDGDYDDGIDGKAGPYTAIARMIGATDTSFTLNPGTSYQFTVDGKSYASLPDYQGKPVGKTSLENLLISGLQGIVTDKNSITFGDVTLDAQDFDNIMYDGRGGTLIVAPTKTDSNGRKVIDLDVLKRWKEANDDLKSKGIDINDSSKINEIYNVLRAHKLEGLVNIGDKKIDYSKFGMFMAVNAVAVTKSDRAQEKFENSKFVVEQDDDDDIVEMLNKALSTNEKQDNYEVDTGWWGDNLYSGVVYIPISNNPYQSMVAEGQTPKESVAQAREHDWQRSNKMLSAQKPDSSLMNNK